MKVGIIGAGTMGSGIAQAFAANETYEVLLCDISAELAEAGKAKIKAGIDKQVGKGRMEQAEAAGILGRITPGVLEQAGGCTLIVEAAVENMKAKKALLKTLEGICRPETVFATNTSSLSVTELGRDVKNPVVGMHFFNPAPVMKLVEIIEGLRTPPRATELVTAIAVEIGKTPVKVQEEAGFVVNRILVPMINEAVGVLADGVASAEDIDLAMKLGANHPIGPLGLGDLIGLDVCLAIMEVMHEEFGEDKYRPHPLLRKMVRAGRLGRKTGEGFFSYS